ncbi:MATE family efflux transporter [Vibrio sp. HA2012]|uniref:MATE family efflux transporter n=1 Tax=Vibrio sp. HA2012 TaxID=1971595 RepID=UPI000C2CA94C|nr:MATE family efflux transporter [Vibrio sp. HA2012]PJC87456.1 MATE family efflux transporter [Vibrio sp. HA2012]
MTSNFATKTAPTHLLSSVARLAFPVALQSALVAILALADVLMVSDFGKEATAAVGIASKWHFVAIMIMAGLTTSSGVLVSQYWGKEDKESAKTVSVQAMKLGILLMLPVTLLITLFSDTIMLLQTNDYSVITLGSQYLWFSFPVLILTHLVIVTESSLRSSNDAVLPLLVGTLTIFINIALNFWLIRGGLGIEAMGVAGAALATTISRTVQVIILYRILKYRNHWLVITRTLDDGKKLWKSFSSLALTNAANSLLWAIGTLTYQMIFGHLGTTELAVFSMLGPFESLCYSSFLGISVACSVLLGQSLGRSEFAQAQSMTKVFLKSVFTFGLILGGVLLLGRELLLEWLNLTNPELYPMALPAISVLCCGIWLRMLNMIIINGILRSGGENLFCIRMDFIAMWMVGIPLVAYGAFIGQWGFNWVYALMLSEEIVKFSLCFHRYLQHKWVNNLTLQHS